MNMTKKSLRLQGVIYGDMKTERDLISCVENAAGNGVTLLRLYKGRLAESAFFSLYNKISDIAKKENIPLVIGGSIDDTSALNADGAHIKFSSAEELQDIRRKLSGKAFGITVESVEEAVLAQEAGADYIEFADVLKPTAEEIREF